MGDECGSHFNICTFCISDILGVFLPFLTFWGHFRGFSRDSGVLRVIVSYEVMKGIILVAGRVTEVYWWDLGGSKEFLGGLGGF